MAEKKRELWADYAKGICILLVFIGHSDAIPQAVRIFIYLFHMPMFFFCMGYYSSTAGTFGAFAKKRFRQLMVPFSLTASSIMCSVSALLCRCCAAVRTGRSAGTTFSACSFSCGGPISSRRSGS